MSFWDTPGVPHKGWICINVYDVREDGSPPEEAEYETCNMCGNERIRYVHVMAHPQFGSELHVGCVCAEKMSNDYVGPKRRETELRNRAQRRKNWLTRSWRTSAKGNDFLNVEGKNVVIYPDKYRYGLWGYGIDGVFADERYGSKTDAKLAAFDGFWELTK